MKIDDETKQAEKEIKEALDKGTNAGGSGPDIPWNSISVQLAIQIAVEKIIQKRMKAIIESRV